MIDHTTTETILRGALRAWGIAGFSAVLTADEAAGTCKIYDVAGQGLASVRRLESPLGPVWSVRVGDHRERVFPSVVPLLRYLRGHLCPEREAGRVLFGPGGRA